MHYETFGHSCGWSCNCAAYEVNAHELLAQSEPAIQETPKDLIADRGEIDKQFAIFAATQMGCKVTHEIYRPMTFVSSPQRA